MNGVVSTLQRRQGLNYKINFGVEIPRIKEIAAQYGKNRLLAQALWQQDIRECRMIAIFTMPVEDFSSNEADEWITTARYTELADQLSMNLLSKMPQATDKALALVQKEDNIAAYCGFTTLAHLLRQGAALNKEQQQKYINATAQTLSASSKAGTIVKQRAYNTFSIFADTAQADKEEINKYPPLKELFNL